MFLETTDGTAILGYAGLGATASGTEPTDWMSAVLRGRNLPLEQSLAVLAEALKKQFPRHMLRIAGRRPLAHNVFVPAFLGKEPRLYTIDLVFGPDRQSYAFRYIRHVVEKPALAAPRTPRIGLAGSGALYLAQDTKWMRSLLHIVRANDRGHLPSDAVADHLASLNNTVSLGMKDKSVGPRCIVAWRHRKGGVHKIGGGQQFYTNKDRVNDSSDLPTISWGQDINAIGRVIVPRMFEAMRSGQPEAQLLNSDEIKAELARLPDKPDENLR
jgi:hypothetical protein